MGFASAITVGAFVQSDAQGDLIANLIGQASGVVAVAGAAWILFRGKPKG